MDIAIGALVMIILLMPGASLIKGYYTSIKRKESAFSIPLQDLLLRGLVFSMVIHVTALCILTFLKVLPQTATLYGILEGKELKISQSELTRFVIQFCTYSLSLIFISFIVGKAMKFLVERKHLDVQFQALRTTNY